MLWRNKYTWRDDQRKNYPNPKRPPKEIAPWNYRTISCLQQKFARFTIHESNADCSPKNRKDDKREQEEQVIYFTLIDTSSRGAKRTEKIELWHVLTIKSIRYGPAKLDNWLFSNVQDMRQNHKVYRENHGKLKSRNEKCRLCGDRDEVVNHVISECRKQAQNEGQRDGDSYPMETV